MYSLKEKKRDIDLLNIYRYYQYVKKNVFENDINSNTIYSDYAKKKLSLLNKILIFQTDVFGNNTYVNTSGIGWSIYDYGVSQEKNIWEVLAIKLINHPMLDYRFIFISTDHMNDNPVVNDDKKVQQPVFNEDAEKVDERVEVKEGVDEDKVDAEKVDERVEGKERVDEDDKANEEKVDDRVESNEEDNDDDKK